VSEAGAKIVFVAGLSGSGKSTAMAALEDVGFYGVDNLPAQLIPQFLDLCEKATPPIEKVALAVDTREEPFLRTLPDAVRELRASGSSVKVLFLECGDEVLQERYRETRRVHPLSPAGTVAEGIERERALLTDLVRLADIQIDTSSLNVHQLKETVGRKVSGAVRYTVINLVSFGYRYSIPANAELLFDVRFLPNPYFEAELRERTGLEAEVADYVMKTERGVEVFERLKDFLSFLLPMYDQEGKAYLTLGIGCTGGRHRSVAMIEALAAQLRKEGREVNVQHRDVTREG
jgi:UPF0042 nucleotide-binding protein